MRSLAVKGLILLLLLFCSHRLAGQAGRESPSHKARVTYTEVVDRVFEPGHAPPAAFKEFQRRIVLRFLPSWGPELQIVILDKGNGAYCLVQYLLRKETLSIYGEYYRVLRSKPEASIEEVVSRIEAEKKQPEVTNSISRLIDNVPHLSIPMNLSSDITLDGTIYELWVQTPSNQIHARFSDGAYGDATDATSIILWIKAVRAEIEAQN